MFVDVPVEWSALVLVFTWIALLVLHLARRHLLAKYNLLFGGILMLLLISLGHFRVKIHSVNPAFLIHTSKEVILIGTALEDARSASTMKKVVIRAQVFDNSGKYMGLDEILLFYPKMRRMLHYGDRVMARADIQPVQDPMNPNEFNYKIFLERKGIFFQGFVKSDSLAVIGYEPPHILIGLAMKFRAILTNKLSLYIKSQPAQSVMKALLLGNRTELNPELKEQFAVTGVMHVLAVSGLHVGIIYLILLWILGERPDRIKRPRVVMVVVLPLLWGYSYVTGLSPSVMRAALLFSILLIGKSLNRKTSSINSLAVSAFILLLINPLLLVDVGFQLSYMAVLGIIFVYPVIQKWWLPGNKILLYLWQLMAVSLAAQLFTFPMSMYYFHRFPTYFLLANLLVIPLVTLLIWGGVIMLSSGAICYVCGLSIGRIIEKLIVVMEKGLLFFGQLPFSSVDGIHLTMAEVVIIYFIILSIGACYIRFSAWKFSLAFMLILLFFSYRIYQVKRMHAYSGIVFYSLSTGWAIDFINHGQVTMATDMSFPDNIGRYQYSILPNRLVKHLPTSVNTSGYYMRNTQLGKLISWHNRTILIASDCTSPRLWKEVDYVLVSSCYPIGEGQKFSKVLINRSYTSPKIHLLKKEGALEIKL